MANRNYQKELEKKIESFHGETKKLFLHSCCAPCSSYVLKYLSDYFEIIDFYYNPNITDEEEYEKRSKELQRLINEMPHQNEITFVEGAYSRDLFFQEVKGLENEPEGGMRCRKCFEMRLLASAEMAKKMGADFFTTTLTISPLKNADILNEIGERISKETGVPYLPSDFKKKDGYRQSVLLSKEYGLYRQDYCGCIYSKLESEKRRKEVESRI